MISMPKLKQVPSLNYTASAISHDLVVMHVMEGGYEGSVAWLCDPRAQASVHLCMNEDGTEVTQLVPLQYKAWAQKAFNAKGISVELPGFTAKGLPEARWRAGARIAAWICHAYGIPPVWAKGGVARGVCQHVDLGAAGGGHHDCAPVDGEVWTKFMTYVKEEFDGFTADGLPEWALHGLPNPGRVALPPNAEGSSHGGVPRKADFDASHHPGPSGFPLGSIKDWQWRLRQVGANPELGVDGAVGLATRSAIRTFQKANGLSQSGEIDSQTWAALWEATK